MTEIIRKISRKLDAIEINKLPIMQSEESKSQVPIFGSSPVSYTVILQ